MVSADSQPAVGPGGLSSVDDGGMSRSVADVIATPCAGSSTVWAKGIVGSSQCRATPTSRSVPSMRSICIQSTNPSDGPVSAPSRSPCHPDTGPDARISRPRMAPSRRERSVDSSSSARPSRMDFRLAASLRSGAPSSARAARSGSAALASSSGAGWKCAWRS